MDKKNGIIWYKHKYNSGTNSRIYLYFGKRIEDNQYYLGMVIAYYASSELFINEYIFTIDDEEHVLIPRKTIQIVEMRDNPSRMDNVDDESKGICEVYDVLINQEEFNLMEKISNAKTVKLRYNGVKGFKRVKIHKNSKKAIKDVLNAFKELITVSDK